MKRTAVRKVCLLGAPGVGKTSLALRLCAGRFDATPPDERGISVCRSLSAGNDMAAFDCWDFAGTTALDTLNQAFLSGADIVLGVADANRAETLDSACRLLALAQALQPGVSAVLLLNKIDLVSGAAPAPTSHRGFSVHAVSARTGHGVPGLLARFND